MSDLTKKYHINPSGNIYDCFTACNSVIPNSIQMAEIRRQMKEEEQKRLDRAKEANTKKK